MPNRRPLLQGMGGVILAAGTATAASAASPLERVRLMKSYIVNLADDALVSDALALGAPLALTREPQRSFDASSIAVFHGDLHLGYLPGNQSKLLAPMVDAGFALEASVVGVGRLPRPSVELDLYILRA